MKLPKKVIICGKEVKVETDKKCVGGRWASATNLISIGTRNPNEVADTFLHEVIEVVFVESGLRFERSRHTPENGEFVFVMTHQEFEIAVGQIAYALKDVLKD